MLRIERTYEPRARGDGRRILIEHLWPRGMKKAALDVDVWMKDVAPSTKLRQSFGHRAERWDEFCRRYRKALDANPAAWVAILAAERRGPVTLLYSARDVIHNGATVLRDYLAGRGVWGRHARRASGDTGASRPASRQVSPRQGDSH